MSAYVNIFCVFVLFFFSVAFYLPACFLKRERSGVGWGESVEDMGGNETGEITTRIYCLKIIFNKNLKSPIAILNYKLIVVNHTLNFNHLISKLKEFYFCVLLTS